MKSSVFRGVTPCSLVEGIYYSETLVAFYGTTRIYIPNDSILPSVYFLEHIMKCELSVKINRVIFLPIELREESPGGPG
jgi:hypothetical protein